MASVRKLDPNDPKSPWVCEYTDTDGKRRRKTPKTGLKKDADAIKRKIERELEDGTHVAKVKSVSFREAADDFYRHCEMRHRNKLRMSGNQLARYRWLIAHHVPEAMRRRSLLDISHDHLQDAISSKHETLAPASIRALATFYGMVLKHAIRKGWLKHNVLRDYPLALPSVERRSEVPSKTDLKALLQTLSQRRYDETGHTYSMRVALVALALFAGLRRGECVGLQWENVDFVAGKIYVRHNFSYFDGLKEPKSKAGVRDISMAPPVRVVLENLAREAGPNPQGYVLTGRQGSAKHLGVQNIWKNQWCPMMKAAGLMGPDGRPKFTLHQLRHAAISLLIEQGLDPLRIKKLAGHSSIQMTMDIYGHLFPEDMRSQEAIEAASAQFTLETDRRPSRQERRAALELTAEAAT